MGLNLEAHTFPEFLGRRYNSRFIQRLGGIVIFVFMPLYAGVVLIGAARFIESTLNVNFILAFQIKRTLGFLWIHPAILPIIINTDGRQVIFRNM